MYHYVDLALEDGTTINNNASQWQNNGFHHLDN